MSQAARPYVTFGFIDRYNLKQLRRSYLDYLITKVVFYWRSQRGWSNFEHTALDLDPHKNLHELPMKKKDAFTAGGIILAGFVIIAFVSKDMIAQRFPTFGSLLQSGFGISAKNQEADIAMKQEKTLAEANEAIAAAEKLSAETVTPTAPAVQSKSSLPWKLNSADSEVTPNLTLNSKIKMYSAVTVDPHPEHLPREGEQIELPMFNGKSVKVNVESSESNDNGDYIWSGHLDGHNNDYPIVMTYGENTTFATITTPEGSYSLEAVKGVGWLYKNPSEAELTAEGKNDFLIPEIN